jgi:hypothetical protein
MTEKNPPPETKPKKPIPGLYTGPKPTRRMTWEESRKEMKIPNDKDGYAKGGLVKGKRK